MTILGIVLIKKGFFLIVEFIVIFVCLFVGMFSMQQLSNTYKKYDDYCDVGEKCDNENYTIIGIVKEVKKTSYNYQYIIHSTAGDFYVYTKNIQKIYLGNKVEVTGSIKAINVARNPGNFDEKQYLRNNKVIGKLNLISINILDTSKNEIKIEIGKIKEKLEGYIEKIASNEAGTLNAMLFGNKEGLDDKLKEEYQNAGIIHILAISGLHISTVGMMFFNLFRKRFSYYASTLVSTVIMIGFGILTGNSVSTKRALIMFFISLVSKLLGMVYDMKNSLCMAGILLLIENAYYIFNISFLLTMGTVFGIAFIYPVIYNTFCGKLAIKNIFIDNFIKTLIISLSITIVTLPLLAYSYYQIPTMSILINLLVIPLMSVVLCMGLLSVVLAYIWIYAGVFTIGIDIYILQLFEKISRLYMIVPGSILYVKKPSILTIFIYYSILSLTILYLFFKAKYGKSLCLFMLLILAMLILFNGKSERIVVIDVGQGDCTFIQSDNFNILIDGGSSDISNVGKYRIAPTIRSYGTKHLDAVFVSHTDSDHINGIMEIIEDELLEIDLVLLPKIDYFESTAAFKNFLREKEVKFLEVDVGQRISFNNMYFTNISPFGAGDNINSKSMVLILEKGSFLGLFTGDISSNEEVLILKSIEDYINNNTNSANIITVNMLKVAHHGSGNSSCEEFINKLNIKLATISCGINNSYGHPDKNVVEKIKKTGAYCPVTSECGGIIIEDFSDKKVVDISTYIN